ncbi:MAG: molybdenum cofactor guanylyltransferase [Hydrogenothermus sp.]|nr:MAG: molybdenum cofactor guanylyltransferase [Hydrogenothermus sp.]
MSLSCIVLAGGKSKRMGKDKAFLDFKGKPFLRHILEKLSEISDNIVVIVNKDFSNYSGIIEGFPQVSLVKDLFPYEGPLNGVISAKNYVKHEKVLISTCDIPVISTELIKYLAGKIEGYDMVLPIVNEKRQPFNTVYKKNSLEIAENIFKNGNRSLMKWIDNLKKVVINENEIKNFKNAIYMYQSINTPEDYKNFLKTFTKGGEYE